MSEVEQEHQSPLRITFFRKINEEQEWESIVRKDRVKNALRRLAVDALRQEARKETEEVASRSSEKRRR